MCVCMHVCVCEREKLGWGRGGNTLFPVTLLFINSHNRSHTKHKGTGCALYQDHFLSGWKDLEGWNVLSGWKDLEGWNSLYCSIMVDGSGMKDRDLYKFIASSAVSSLSTGVYRFVTYNNAIWFLSDALHATTLASETTQGQSWGEWLWSPISYTNSQIYRAIGWNNNTTPAVPPSPDRSVLLWSAGAVVTAEVFNTFIEAWIRKNCQQHARIIRLSRLCTRTVQMGAVGFYAGRLNGLAFGVTLSLLLNVPAIIYNEMNGSVTEELVEEEHESLRGSLVAALVISSLSRLKIEENLRTLAVVPLAITMATKCERSNRIQDRMRRELSVYTLWRVTEAGVLGVQMASALSYSIKDSLITGAVFAATWAVSECIVCMTN